MSQDLDHNFINQFGATLAEQIEQTIVSNSLRYLDRGEGNIDAAQITAATNVLAIRLIRLGVTEQDAVNALVQTMRGLKKMLAAQPKSPDVPKKGPRKAAP